MADQSSSDKPQVINEPEFPTTAREALHTDKSSSPCANTGNPVFSCIAKVDVSKEEVPGNKFYHPHHPLYQTSTSTYGEIPASPHTAPSTFHGKSQRFSQHLGTCGMYRNHSLNTALDKSKVYDLPQMISLVCKMLNFLDKDSNETIFKGNVLIVPAISVGNVGQLSCDLLISTLKLKKIAYFCTQCFLPLVGLNPFATNKTDTNILMLNSEVYNCQDRKITVLQLRSPLVKGKESEFCTSLLKFANEAQFSEIVVLSSCHAFERTDEQLIGSQFRYLLSPQRETFSERFSGLNWKKLEERTSGYGDKDLFLPGGGFTKKLYLQACKDNINMVVLMLFCAEGNNIPEATLMVNHLNAWKQLIESKKNNEEKWKFPMSWSHMFGNSYPEGIF